VVRGRGKKGKERKEGELVKYLFFQNVGGKKKKKGGRGVVRLLHQLSFPGRLRQIQKKPRRKRKERREKGGGPFGFTS